MRLRILLLLAALLVMGAASLRVGEPTAVLARSAAACQPLGAASGNVVTVGSVGALTSAVNSAAAGTTVLVQDGTYNLNGAYLRIAAPNVTLRSVSGNPAAVVLDGNYATTEILQIVASNVTVAEITLREAYYHPIHVSTEAGAHTTGTNIYRVRVIDPGEQAIKINPGSAGWYTDNGTVACSHID